MLLLHDLGFRHEGKEVSLKQCDKDEQQPNSLSMENDGEEDLELRQGLYLNAEKNI